MNFSQYLTKQNILIAGAVAILTMFALWLRIIPMLIMGNMDNLSLVSGDDPIYNLRQVEQILANFPNYAWFDPLVYYPNGDYMYWGALFPTIIAVCCKILGATTQSQIISVGLLVPCIMGALLVPLLYYIGKTCGDWKTGLLAAGFTAIVTGQFFHRSMYGYMDHHIAEVLFSTLFCLLYMYILATEYNTKITLRDLHTHKHLILLSVLAGVAYLLGLFVMPTMILFAMIVVIFTCILFVINMLRGKNSEYLLVMNTIIFLVAAIGTYLHGVSYTYLDLSIYSIWHVYSYLLVIAITAVLYLLAQYTLSKKKDGLYFIGLLIGLVVAAIVILYAFSPQLYTLFISSFFAFFGQQAVTATVQEARAWTPIDAWAAFSFGLLLMFGGVIVALYKNIKENHPHMVFVLVWSVVMLYSTYQHVRYEYYLAINVALLSALCVSFLIDLCKKDIEKMVNKITSTVDVEPVDEVETPKVKPPKKNRKAEKIAIKRKSSYNYVALSMLAMVIVMSVMFAVISSYMSYSVVSINPTKINPDWKESLEWMRYNTPEEIGVNFTQIYDPKTYKAPESTYGVMSWWDYGHMILYIAHRFPNANPFQHGITGEAGSANFFLSVNETEANNILDAARTKYVITDSEMDTGKFWAMSTWYNATESAAPYQTYFLAPQDAAGNYGSVLVTKDKYFLTMISRLHNFDGSLTEPTSAFYVEYVDPVISQMPAPTMINAKPLAYEEAKVMASNYNAKAPQGYHAIITNINPTLPTVTVPALQHYRLVHESPTSTLTSNKSDIKYVKTFEYVKGAHIKGDGIIEVPIITNTGRQYIYSQASINGEFIVPYSTTGNNYSVRTTGKYTNTGTGQQFEISEESVINGV